jgi:hypothetical protein
MQPGQPEGDLPIAYQQNKGCFKSHWLVARDDLKLRASGAARERTRAALNKQQKSGLEVNLGGESKINSDEFSVLKVYLNCNNHPKRLGIPRYRTFLYLQPKRLCKRNILFFSSPPRRLSNFLLSLCAANPFGIGSFPPAIYKHCATACHIPDS